MADIMTASSSPQFLKTVATRRRPKPYTPVAPLAVPPLEAARLLSCGLGHVYGLMDHGELESFSSGRARRVTTKSIEAYVARQLAKADTKACDPAEPPPARRRRKQRKGA
jgi:excisionase family DNA binding protein